MGPSLLAHGPWRPRAQRPWTVALPSRLLAQKSGCRARQQRVQASVHAQGTPALTRAIVVGLGVNTGWVTSTGMGA